jgi:hypothetical protein
MMIVKVVSPAVLLAFSVWCLPGAAAAGDSNATANAQRIRATIAAQSMLGYPPVVNSYGSGCCCPGATASYPSANLQQQIAALSAALKQTPEPAKLSPAALAEGAY